MIKIGSFVMIDEIVILVVYTMFFMWYGGVCVAA